MYVRGLAGSRCNNFHIKQTKQDGIITIHDMRKHLRTARQPEVVRTALRFALVVGPILVFINHGDAIIAGTMDSTAWLKSALTMVVPYTVSTLSSISAYHSCRSDSEQKEK